MITNLSSNKEDIQDLLNHGFKLKNISSILSGSGAKAAEAINALVANKDQLISLGKKGFTTANLASILSRSGAIATQRIIKMHEEIKRAENSVVELTDEELAILLSPIANSEFPGLVEQEKEVAKETEPIDFLDDNTLVEFTNIELLEAIAYLLPYSHHKTTEIEPINLQRNASPSAFENARNSNRSSYKRSTPESSQRTTANRSRKRRKIF